MSPKVWYKSNTLWLNAILIMTSVLALATTSFNFSESTLKIMMFSIGVLGILNRFVSAGSGELTLKDKS